MEGTSRAPHGWRVLAAGSLALFGLVLGVMAFVLLPAIPPKLFGGVSRIAMETGAAVRDQWWIFGAVFTILSAGAGFGKADRFLKFLTAVSVAGIAFFAVATWWAIRYSPVGSIKF